MDDNLAQQSPEGRLIEEARDRLGISQNEAAERAGMSGTRWRQIVYGNAGPMTSRRGVATLARMARVVGVRHEHLDEAGRTDVADDLRQIYADEQIAESEGPTVAELAAELAEQKRRTAEQERRTSELERRLEELLRQQEEERNRRGKAG